MFEIGDILDVRESSFQTSPGLTGLSASENYIDYQITVKGLTSVLLFSWQLGPVGPFCPCPDLYYPTEC